MPSVVFEAKSMTPVTGLTTSPAKPLAAPFMNPKAPYRRAFSKG